LTGWRLDVTSETNYNQALKDGYRSLLDLQGVGPKRASDLYEEGFRSAEDVAGATVDDLSSIEGMTENRAKKLIDDAVEYTSRVDSADVDAEEAAPDEPDAEEAKPDEPGAEEAEPDEPDAEKTEPVNENPHETPAPEVNEAVSKIEPD